MKRYIIVTKLGPLGEHEAAEVMDEIIRVAHRHNLNADLVMEKWEEDNCDARTDAT